jgi:hypothetical protein
LQLRDVPIAVAAVVRSRARRRRRHDRPDRRRIDIEGPKNIPPISSFKPMTLDYSRAASRVEDVTARLASILGL